MALLDYCLERLEKNQKVNRQSAWAAMQPTVPFDYQKLANFQTYLMRLAREFLGIEEYRGDDFKQSYHFVSSLKGKQIETGISKAFDKLEALIAKGTDELPERYAREWLYTDLRSRMDGDTDHRRLNDMQDRQLAALDKYYLAQRLRIYCEKINQANILNHEEEAIPEPWFLQQLETLDEYAAPDLVAYRQVLGLLSGEGNEKFYQNLRGMVLNPEVNLPLIEQAPLYAYAMNFCIKKANLGASDYLEELFNWYQGGLDSGLLVRTGHISQWDFKNAVALGCQLNKLKWTNSFIENYGAFLPEDIRENALTYNRAYLYCAKEEFVLAKRLLNQVKFTNDYYNLGAKVLLIRIYYLQQEDDALEMLLLATEKTLRRNKQISSYQKKSHLNLIRFVKKVMRLRNKSYANVGIDLSKQANELKAQIENVREIVNIKWLLSMVEDLDKNST